MKISKLLLSKWVECTLNEKKLAALLSMAGLEVDSISPVAGEFNGVVVAEVTETRPHPQADKLTLCTVNNGKSFIQVVCGASNVRSGLKVALAEQGANLPGGIEIKETMLRGEVSQGMLCSASELRLSEHSEGIIELGTDAPLGMNLRDYLSLDDVVLDIDLTPNRADCFSVRGIAREIAALTHMPLKSLPTEKVSPKSDSKLPIRLEAPEACPQYAGRIIHNINPQAKTPIWMAEYLRRLGIRPIHPVVDITNFVMLELGQPMHAFDCSTLEKEIVVRFARADETIELLDGQLLSLDEKILVIADHKKPLAMAGIMGGKASAVKENTVDIFLESAFFNPVAMSGMARKYGLLTESSQRFERGVDPCLQQIALERATHLLIESVGGVPGPLLFATKSEFLPQPRKILFNPERAAQITGLELSYQKMLGILTALGMKVDSDDAIWKVDVPSYRFDIQLDVDLIEEIARLYGYDNLIGKKMLTTVQAGSIEPFEALTQQLSQWLIARGYHETISYSFVDPRLQQLLYPKTPALSLLNPISSELSHMRLGMWPGLIASMTYNLHRQQSAIKFFESGVIFEGKYDNSKERHCLAGLLTGEHGALHWNEPSSYFDFYDAKGDLQALFSLLHLKEVEFLNGVHPTLHPGLTTRIVISGKEAGWCGVLHPKLAEILEIPHNVVLFEIFLDALMEVTPVKYRKISKFPQMRRDLSFLIHKKIAVSEIEAVIREKVDSAYLKAVHWFDVYTGSSIPKDKKSLAVALIFQNDERTMIDKEINAIMDDIIKELNEKFDIILRD